MADAPPPRRHWWRDDADALAWLRAARPTLTVATRTIDGVDLVYVTEPKNQFFPGVGADKLWPAAERTCRYLREFHADAGRVLDFGCGVGVVGMFAAKALGARVLLTDLPWLLPLTEESLHRNFEATDARRPELAALRWGCLADVAALGETLDLVVGSDVAYFKEDLPKLLDTLAAIGAAHNVIAVQHRDGYDKHLVEAVRARRGWAIEAADGFCCSRVSLFKISPPPRSVVLVRAEGRSEWRWATS